MEHQVLADESAIVGEAIWKQAGPGIQEQSRRADAVARHLYDACLLPLQASIRVIVDHSIGKSIHPEGYFPDSGVGLKYRSLCYRLGPIGNIGAGLGSQRASDFAWAAVVTRGSSVIWPSQNRAV